MTVLVGMDKKSFIVHKDMICSRSSFFKAACSGVWSEAKERKVELPDYSPPSFKIYLEWAYSQSADLGELARAAIQPGMRKYEGDQPISERKRRTCDVLCELWMLADYLGDNTCKNKVVDTLIKESNEKKIAVSSKAVSDVYKKTPSGCGLQRWLTDAMLPIWTFEKLNKLSPSEEFPPKSFLLLSLKRLMAKKGPVAFKDRPQMSEASNYHDYVIGA